MPSRHGLSYTKISSAKNDILSEVLYFVPLGMNAEVQKVVLKNNSKKTKSFKLYSFTEWCLWNALDDMTNFQRNYLIGEVEIEDSILYHKTRYKERRDHYLLY
jgi:cellobiose phosphorylase